jgi:hypothetical protein
MKGLSMKGRPTMRMPFRNLVATAVIAAWLPIAALAATPASTSASSNDDTSREFKTVMLKRGDTAVPVKFVMSVSGMGSEQQQEGQTQGTLVSADGLILVPGRVVSLDLGAFTHGNSGLGGGGPSAKSGQFRVRLAGSDEWLPADLVTRDTELGIAWLRLRHPTGKLPYVDFTDLSKVALGTQLFTVMRTSDQFGSVPIVRAGYVLGETTVPRPTFLVDGSPGFAFDGDGKPAGYVDVDLAGLMRSRSSSGSIGMDLSDSVFSMIPADRIGRVTAQASVLPVVKSTDSDDADPLPPPVPARKHAALVPSAPETPNQGAPPQPSPSQPSPSDDQANPDAPQPANPAAGKTQPVDSADAKKQHGG